MVNVFIKTDSKYSVSREAIKKTIEEVLEGKKVKGDTEISVAIVGDRMMRKLNKRYRNFDETTDVLAFPNASERSQAPFVDPPDDILRLGEIVISYPQARDSAAEENKFVDEKIDELIRYAMGHLLGQNHEEY